jgi:hypothetical protein
LETFPVTRKNQTEPIIVWTTEPPTIVFIADEKEPKCLFPEKTAMELFHYILPDEFLKKIEEYTNERINVEYEISIDLQFLKFYKSIFTEISNKFNKIDEMKLFNN